MLLKKTLIEFGLSDKEATVYLGLLELEVATVQEVTKKTDLNRSSIYVVLDMLKKRGLVSISKDKSILRYVATPPEVLLRSAQDKANAQEQVLQKIQAMIPEMKALHKDTKQRPKVRIFEGREGLISAFEDTLKCKEKIIRVSSSVENLIGIIPPDYFPEYMKKRIRLGIVGRGIHPENEFAHTAVKNIPKIYNEHILIPENKFKFPADLAIYDDIIGCMSPEKGGFAILIESKEIADVMKSTFDLAWEEAKRLATEAEKQNKKKKA